VATGTAHEDSDVDLLCDTEPGATLYDIASCEIDLEQALGFPVTIVTKASLTNNADKAMVKAAVPVC
jgi:predicted nucleotidyltransferase